MARKKVITRKKKANTVPGYFYCQTWMMNYYYCIGWTQKELFKYVKKRFDHELDFAHCNTGKMIEFVRDDTVIMLIWVSDKKDLDSLVHECVHAANFTLNMKNWKPDFNNDEPHAYLVQSIFRKALDSIN